MCWVETSRLYHNGEQLMAGGQDIALCTSSFLFAFYVATDKKWQGRT